MTSLKTAQLSVPTEPERVRNANLADSVLDALDRPDLRRIGVQIDALLSLGLTKSGHPLARPKDCAQIVEGLEEAIEAHQRALEVDDDGPAKHMLELIERLEGSAIQGYGAEALRLALVKARALLLTGRASEALAIIEPFAERPYRIEGGFFQMLDVFELDLRLRAALGRTDEVTCTAMGRARCLAQLEPKFAWVIFRRMFRNLALVDAPANGIEGLTAKIAQIMLAAQRRRHGWAAKALRLVLHFAAFLLGGLMIHALRLHGAARIVQIGANAASGPQAAKRGEGRRRDKAILVTRPMGGIGDIAMMLPGLEVLHQRRQSPIDFAIPKKFHPPFQGNRAVRLLDSDAFIDLSAYHRWVHLGFCPAARYESRAAPFIKRGRVDVFAGAMQVKRRELDQAGRIPKLVIDAQQARARDHLRARLGANGRKVIGIAMHSRETYRDYPHMQALMILLAQQYGVLAIHHRACELPDLPNIEGFFGRSLGEVSAAVAACDLLVSVDTALLHFSGAFGIPAIAVFGPTSGAVRTQHLPLARVVEASPFACRPCWRNEDQHCLVTRDFSSACLHALTPERILAAIDEALAAAP